MRGEKFLRVIVIVLCSVVASYFVFSVVRTPNSGYATYKAVLYEVGDGISTSGFVVRDEQTITGARDIVVLTRSEGERVGKGQSVASTFHDAEAQARQNRIDALEEELAQMEYAYSFSASDAESATLDADIIRTINQITVYNERRDFDFAAGSSEQLKSYILRRYITAEDSETLWKRITDTRDQLSELYTLSKTETGSILTDQAGYFSGMVDGYETVLTLDFLNSATPSQVDQVRPLEVGGDVIGKLVLSPRWRYLAVVDSDSIQGRRTGQQVQVSFAYDFYENVPMRIDRIGPDEDGRCVIVLSSEQYIQDAVVTRVQSADLIFDDISGLRVPKTAIYVRDLEDGSKESGVYVLEGAEAAWKSVNILYDNGESYIVELDKSSTDNLWPDDEIILTKEEMFEGKVMFN